MPLLPLVDEKISEADIAAFEQRLGAVLPADYRDFLLATNGGQPEPLLGFEFSETTGDESGSLIRYFLCLLPANHPLSIIEMLFGLDYQGRLVSGYVPIGEDPLGNYVLLSTLPHDYGHVYFWDHEEEDEDEASMCNMSLIAPSFTAFMAGLTEDIPL